MLSVVCTRHSHFFLGRQTSKNIGKFSGKATIFIVLLINMKISLILGVLTCFSIAYADQETLVLVDNLNIKETHSQFFKSLQGKF